MIETEYTYKVFLQRDQEPDLNITELIISGSFSDSEGDSVGKLSLTLGQIYLEKYSKYTDELITLGSVIKVKANDELVFFGKVWDNDLSLSTSQTVSVVVYDDAQFLAKSKHSVVYNAGFKTSELVKDICSGAGYSVHYDYPEITHDTIFNKDSTRIEEISDLLSKVQAETNYAKPVLKIKNNTVTITAQGSNEKVLVFTISDNNSSEADSFSQVSRSSSISDIITRVVIHGLEVEENMRPIDAIHTGKTEFGNIDYNYFTEKEDTLEQTRKKVQAIFDENGDVKHSFTFEAPDIPTLRKGDRIKIKNTGSFEGYFFILSITHDIKSKKMSFTAKQATTSI